jgi:hypothetical protein
MVDFVEKDQDFFIPIIGVKLEIGIGKRSKVRKGEWKEPVIFKVDINKAAAGNGRSGVGAEMVDKLMDKIRFAASTGAGYSDHRRRTG